MKYKSEGYIDMKSRNKSFLEERSIDPNIMLIAVKNISIFCGIVLVFFLLLISSTCFRTVSKQRMIYSIDGSSLSRNQVREMYRVEQSSKVPISFLVWRQTGNVQIRNPDLNRMAMVPIVEISGDAVQNIFECDKSLAEDDEKGCLLDTRTAELLFGSAEASGKKILWDGKTYIVRGIVQSQQQYFSSQQMMVIRTASPGKANTRENDSTGVDQQDGSGFFSEKDSFNLLAFSRSITEIELSGFQSRHGIAGKELLLSFFGAGGYVGLHFFSFFTLFSWIAFLFGVAKKERNRPVLKAGILLFSILVFVGLWFLLGLNFNPSNRFFPSRIADFSFWKKLFTDLGDEISLLFSLFTAHPVHFLFQEMGKGILSGGVACILGVVLVHLIKIDSIHKIFIWSMISLGAAAVSIYLSSLSGLQIFFVSGSVFLFPLLFLHKIQANKNKNIIRKMNH